MTGAYLDIDLQTHVCCCNTTARCNDHPFELGTSELTFDEALLIVGGSVRHSINMMTIVAPLLLSLCHL